MKFRRVHKYRMHHSVYTIPESWNVQRQSIFRLWWYTLERYSWRSSNKGYPWERAKSAEEYAIKRVKELQEQEYR